MSAMAACVDAVEAALVASPDREISTAQVGEVLIERLKSIDKIAYVRFASVYRNFQDEEDFLQELTKLLRKKEPVG
jgi:transcriptional repressor NrdR